MKQPYISKSYKNSLITVVLLVAGCVVYLFVEDASESAAIAAIVGLAIIIAMITAIRGMIQLYKGRKEEKNAKFMIALLGNGSGILYLISTIIMTISIIW